YSELTTRNDFDFITGNLDQYIKSVESTVEGNKTVLQRVENWQVTNGASIEETVYGFNQKVWLNDVADIGANLIPLSSNSWENGTFWTGSGDYSENDSRIRTIEYIEVVQGDQYTFKDYSAYASAVSDIRIFEYMDEEYTGQYLIIPRGESRTFTATGNQFKIALHPMEGFTVRKDIIDRPDKPIKMKLENGNTATPMLNAISKIEQLANSVAIQVQELDGDFLTQSD